MHWAETKQGGIKSESEIELPSVWSKFLGGEGVVDGEGVAVKDAWSGVVGGP